MCPPPIFPDSSPDPRQALTSKTLVNAQLQSPFICKLPVEIRLQIYQEALGRQSENEILHFSSNRGNPIYCVRCTGNHNRVDGSGCLGVGLRRRDALLPLPLTCRLIYSEAIDTLYTDNTFELCPYLLPKFVRPLPVPRISVIRRLVLRLSVYLYGEDAAGYQEMCDWEKRELKDIMEHLNAMEGLRSLKVEVVVHARFMEARGSPFNSALLEILRDLPVVGGEGTVIAFDYEEYTILQRWNERYIYNSPVELLAGTPAHRLRSPNLLSLPSAPLVCELDGAD